MIGARWDLVHNMALKAQWDAIRGEPTSIFPYRQEGRMVRKDGCFSLTMDFVF